MTSSASAQPTTVIPMTMNQVCHSWSWPSIGRRMISTKWNSGLISTHRARSATAGLSSRTSYIQTIGVRKNSSCTMLWVTGGRSRNRVLTMPMSSATHIPLTTSRPNARKADRSVHRSGCGKKTSMTA